MFMRQVNISKYIFLLFLITYLTFNSILAYAGQNPRIKIEVDRTNIAIDETINLSIHLINMDANSFSPTLPAEFEIEGRANQTSFTMNGNETESSVTQQLALRATKTGRFTIGPFTLKAGNREIKSDAIDITVTQIQQNNTQNQTGQTDHSSQKKLLILTEVSNKTPMEGERFLLKVKILFPAGTANISFLDFNLSAFNVYEFKQEQQKEYQTEISGEPYQVIEMSRTLAAKKNGRADIPALRIRADLPVSINSQDDNDLTNNDPRSVFDNFFNNSFGRRRKTVTAVSKPLALNILPLPNPKPENWSHIVGSFTAHSELSTSSLAAGESTTLTVTLKGAANLNSVSLTPFLKADQMKLYPDKPTHDISLNADGEVVETKTFKIGIVPTQPGIAKIPEMTIPFFNTAIGKYDEIKLQSYSLNVTKNEHDSQAESLLQNSQNLSGINKKNIQIEGSDILPIKNNLEAITKNERVSVTEVFYWYSPFLLIGLILLGNSFMIRKQSSSTDPKILAKRAYEIWKQSVGELEKNISTIQTANNANIYYTQLSKLLKEYICNKAQKKEISLTPPEFKDLLLQNKIPNETALQIFKTLEQMERLELGVESLKSESFPNMLNEIKTNIAQLNEVWQ